MPKKDQNKLYADYIRELKSWQESDSDQRDDARTADKAVLEKDGQWEDSISQQLDSEKRPRYTFDKITPVIESMMADIEDMDFGCNVKPAGDGADKDLALTLEGMIRTIQNNSRADELFRNATRRLMRRGFDAWMVKTKYLDPWSFDQDLVIVPITNSINRVWTSNVKKNSDSSDSDAAYVLTSLSPAAYKEKFPNGSGVSVDDFDIGRNYTNYQPEVITIGERFYKKKDLIEVVQMNNGSVHKVDENFEKIRDEMAAARIFEVNRKKVEDYRWYYCVFDGGGILQEETKTVFKSNPIVTVYGNYEHIGQNSKEFYSGIVKNLLDSQRVHNYAKSREVEEGALAPRGKYWMTKEQAKGNESQLKRMNISSDPVQFYNPDDRNGGVPPIYQGAPQSNPHLVQLGNQMGVDIKEQAGVFSAMQGDFAGRLSEDTVKMQIDRGTAATRKWVNAVITGIRRTCEILVETIPEVYDTKRQFMITGIDGVEDQVVLNEEIYDQQSRQMIKSNDLNKGKYKVVCDAGPAFANKLESSLDALLNYAAVDPTVVQQAGDVMLKAIDAPLVDKIAERKRDQMLKAGLIPESQMTDEEREQAMIAAQSPPPPDPAMVLAQAEMAKAKNEQAKINQNGQLKVMELRLKDSQLQLEAMKLQMEQVLKGNAIPAEQAQAIADIENTRADTAKKIADAEKISGESIGQQIENFQSLQPKVDVVAQG